MVAKGLSDVLTTVEQSDLAYLNKELIRAPALIPWLASLMRDGELELALKVNVEGSQPPELGKQISKGEEVEPFVPSILELAVGELLARSASFG